MDPLLIIEGIIVGVAALLAYITGIAKKVLKARLGKLEKARDALFQRYILVHRHLKAIDGTRKLYSGWVVEKHKKLDELTLELQEWESQEDAEEGEAGTEGRVESDEQEAGFGEGDGSEDGTGDEQQKEREEDGRVQASGVSERPAAGSGEDGKTGEDSPAGSGGDSEKTAADLEEGAGKDEKKDIKVNLRGQRRSRDFSSD